MRHLDCSDGAVSCPVADTKAAHLLVLSHEKKHFFVQLLGQPASGQHQCVSNHFANFDVLIFYCIS